jgi:hypothetical protein
MKKRLLAGMLLLAATMAFAEGKPQTTCPVMGGKVNKELYVDAEGYRIYVCCGGCIGKVKADPEKYIKQLKAKGVELEKAPSGKDEKSNEDHGHHAH